MLFRRLLTALIVFAVLPAAAARAAEAPKLAIYPFMVDGSASRSLGVQFADAIAAEIRQTGGVDVVRGTATLTPEAYRADARAQGADFYVVGAIAPVGSSAYSVLEQLVRTRTGLLAWSGTLQVASVDDLKGQGAQIRLALLDQIGHASFPVLAGASPAPAPAAPVAPAAAASVATATPSTFAVVTFGGTALPGDRALALRAVLENIRRRGQSAEAEAAQPGDLATLGTQECIDTGAATIVGGTLDTSRTASLTAPAATTAAVTLQVFDCRTQSLRTKPLNATVTAQISSDSIRSAADAATTAYFGGPPPAGHL